MACKYLSNDNRTIDMDVDHESKLNLSHREIRVLLLHEFCLGRKETEAANNICNTMGEDVQCWSKVWPHFFVMSRVFRLYNIYLIQVFVWIAEIDYYIYTPVQFDKFSNMNYCEKNIL